MRRRPEADQKDAYDRMPARAFVRVASKKFKAIKKLRKRIRRAHQDFWPWYTRYLASPAWRLFRLSVFARRGAFCEDCGGVKELHLHHLTYKRVGREKAKDVRILCFSCHAARHPDKVL